ncbi:MAG: ABC transporter permease, partial [Oscillospiraceae bacterium]|nr:ABC transporter permease [Oscillospiraceae bacterium]
AHLFKLRIFCIFFLFAVLIAFALRMIIDTAFEVSSKERERHYGVLQSIGATPEQIVRIITYEGLRLCVVSIPLGLIAGIGLAYPMYNVLLAVGLSDMFLGMTNAKLNLPFSVDWQMLLVSAAVGIVWVFLSAYGVGMRIIKKTPMEAITTRANNVEKVRKRTLSGLLFGISGSIASRNARRQKKRFVITVLTLTVSITMFALFTSLANTVENSMNAFLNMQSSIESGGADFAAEIGNRIIGVSYAEAEQALADSGLFTNIGVEVTELYALDSDKARHLVRYLNREAYERIFGNSAPVSYDELVRTGGYLFNQKSNRMQETADAIRQEKLTFFSQHRTIPEGLSLSEIDWKKLYDVCEFGEPQAHEVSVLGTVSREYDGAVLYSAIETYEANADAWFGEPIYAVVATFNFNGTGIYNFANHRIAIDWFNEHFDQVSVQTDFYADKRGIHDVTASVRAGVLILNLLLALAALINLLNIISTGIANRRSELASLQCVGMTYRQLDRMAIIECLQFAGAAAIISAAFCALVVFGSEGILNAIIRDTFVDESKETKKML